MRIAGFAITSFSGYLLGHYLLSGSDWAAYISILVSYHCYLGYLVMNADSKDRANLSGITILIHMVFLAPLIAIPYFRENIPYFAFISPLTPALAPFETSWLLGSSRSAGKDKERRRRMAPMHIEKLVNEATGDDHALFMEAMRKGNRPHLRTGRSMREEFGYWLADRAK
jgi:hypothetical protein